METSNSQPLPAHLLSSTQRELIAIEHNADNAPSTLKNIESALIDAQSDREAIQSYLTIRCKKATTRKAVLRDLRKFAVFMQVKKLTSLAALKAEDCMNFQDWLQDPETELCSWLDSEGNILDDKPKPEPITKRVGDQVVPNPDWRPFRLPLSPESANQTVSKIQSIFSWLCNAKYLTGNPWALVKPIVVKESDEAKANRGEQTPERELPKACIEAVIHYLDHGDGFGQVDARRFAQWRWLFMFYFYTASRISAGCTATIQDIWVNSKGHELLRLLVKGAGERKLDVPWLPEMEEEYHRYRDAMGLAPIQLNKERRKPRLSSEPLPIDQGPQHLLLSLHTYYDTKTSDRLSYDSVHGHIVALFRTVREWAELHEDLNLTTHELGVLSDATGHWIRHGTATLLGEHAKKQLGHTTERQTSTYRAEEVEARRQQLRSLLSNHKESMPLEQCREIATHMLQRIMNEDVRMLEDILAEFS